MPNPSSACPAHHPGTRNLAEPLPASPNPTLAASQRFLRRSFAAAGCAPPALSLPAIALRTMGPCC